MGILDEIRYVQGGMALDRMGILKAGGYLLEERELQTPRSQEITIPPSKSG